MSEKCLFCRIADGEIPARIVAENEGAVAFLDINPISEGHTLIIPRKHYSDLLEIDSNALQACSLLSVKVARSLVASGIAEGINLFSANREVADQTVFHFHIHVIPRKGEDTIRFREIWKPLKITDQKMDLISRKISENIQE